MGEVLSCLRAKSPRRRQSLLLRAYILQISDILFQAASFESSRGDLFKKFPSQSRMEVRKRLFSIRAIHYFNGLPCDQGCGGLISIRPRLPTPTPTSTTKPIRLRFLTPTPASQHFRLRFQNSKVITSSDFDSRLRL